jgi:HrpA-like RNA helicase
VGAQIHVQLVVVLVAHVAATCPPEEGVLVFLAGLDQIRLLQRAMQQHPVLGDPEATWLQPLYGHQSSAEQSQVYRSPRKCA